jgi:diaminohydroxyphosphoribosylaminopyrimidine deaminase/5-amino-6-(5-phosphoribosylamino)uracil reductase
LTGEDAWSERALAPLLAASPARPFVIAQLGQSIDGRIAAPAGPTRPIGGNAALDHLHRLRAHVDAVVVGINTILADDPQLTVRRVPGRSPARVVIDPSGRLPPTAKCLRSGEAPCLVVRPMPAPSPAGAQTVVVEATGGIIPPQAILAALFARGLPRLLIEGGARTISRFIDAGCIDRLQVAVAPLIIGSGKPGLELAPIDDLATALRPRTQTYLLPDGNVLFDCDLRRRAQSRE